MKASMVGFSVAQWSRVPPHLMSLVWIWLACVLMASRTAAAVEAAAAAAVEEPAPAAAVEVPSAAVPRARSTAWLSKPSKSAPKIKTASFFVFSP